MRNSTNKSIALLNEKGKYYRKMILQMSEEELLKLFPKPSNAAIRQLRRRAVQMSRLWSTQN